MITVAVDAGRGEEGGKAVQKLQGREPEGGAAGGIGLLQKVEDLVGAAADEVEAVEGEGAPRAVANEAFEAGTVGGLDADAGVEAEPTAVVPGKHVLGLVGFQEDVAGEVAEHPFSDGVLEAFQELGGEGGGFVEAEAGGWVLGSLVRIDAFEDPGYHTKVVVKMRV